MEVYFHLFIVLAIGRGESSPLPPDRFTPGDRAVVTLGIGVRVSPRDGLGIFEEVKSFLPLLGPCRNLVTLFSSH
jgi:hypothetical protein